MKKKIIGLLVAMFMAVPLLAVDAAVDATSAEAAVPTCTFKIVRDKTTVRAGALVYPRKFYLTVVIGSDYCVNPNGADWMRPRWARVTSNREGAKMSCNRWVTNYADTRFTFYFWDQHSGRNYRKTRISTPCSGDTVSSKSVQWSKRHTPRLYFDKDNGKPRWRVSAEVRWRETGTGYGNMGGSLYYSPV